ncbi:MAG: sulfatase-like hydrolase/transferase [Bacteroidaceae bacterium]|nr:sulfatase-like hydrolase/transferase [Bacteroidaceae bacterium]
MKRVWAFIGIFVAWLLIFAIQKPLFMAWYHGLYADTSWTDWLAVMWHGLKLDASMAGYLTIIPGLLLIAGIWTRRSWVRIAMKTYFIIASALVAIIFIADMALYEFWGFRLDATPLFYFFSSPKDALASVSWLYIIMGILAIFLTFFIIYGVFNSLRLWKKDEKNVQRLIVNCQLSIANLILLVILFIPIRGGFTVSTMNTGKVFYSTDMRLNHAALNPAFNLMESLSKQKDFAHQYRFMDDVEATAIFETMIDKSGKGNRQSSIVNRQSPNVLFIILESFSSKLMATLGGEPNVAVNLDVLAKEGILFSRFYANSFRTDRGLVSILSGYPAQPTTSLMKYPRKTQNLPGIARSLKQAGYEATYYYGGDADFTNMRSYLMAQGFDKVISDVDFPVSERLSKWGAHDEVVFNRLLDDLTVNGQSSMVNRPWFKVLQTSSSHEPFEVPYHRLDNARLNAFAYTDDCLGRFIHAFKQLPQWENTLVVLVPDHLGAYPEHISNLTPDRYQIPLIMIGGAVKEPKVIDTIGSQHDIAATLLSMLGLPHDEFTFSKDMLNPANPHFAFFTVPDAFGMVTDDNILIFDNQAGKTVYDEGAHPGANLRKGQAYLQKLYDDIAKR